MISERYFSEKLSQEELYTKYRSIFNDLVKLFSTQKKGAIIAYEIMMDIYQKVLGGLDDRGKYLAHHILAGSSLKPGEKSLIVDSKIGETLEILEEKLGQIIEEGGWGSEKFSVDFLKKLDFFKNNLKAVVKN